ncbi:MAG: efflux RND transporter periplasmic adaptor subunit [Chitinophagales bacterium]|nr:efflux RND transporter periplasmic adaptor subunit [Chitinophagales bacterium]MCO5247670.1 efflux RND transporter periplasmic adaptor subunit [Chitinophagales bacterium]MCZ2394425.1 efflux RND transporter periplasmic adaptor subunit [Chitinophagales bacterium]
MNNKLSIYLFSWSILFFVSCHSHQDEHGHEHETTATASLQTDENANSFQTSLTEEQIKSVDLQFDFIKQKELTSTLKLSGILNVPNNKKGKVTALFGGVIQTLNVQVGSYVSKGQVIATISNPQFIQIQEEYLSVLNKLTFAEQEFQRQQQLNDNDAGAKKNLQNATYELATLKTKKMSLLKQIQLMGVSTNSTQLQSTIAILSPLSGYISDVYAMIGSYVDVSSPIAEIVDNNSLHLDLQVFEKDLSKIKVGQIIHFTLTNNPGKTYDAKVFSIGSSFENESKSIAVHSQVIGDKTRLIDGMNVIGIVNVGNELSQAVPDNAIVEAEGKYFVIVKMQENEIPADEKEHGGVWFKRVEVFKGVSDLGYTAITPITELSSQDEIITKNAFFVYAKMSNSGGEHAHAH